MHAHNVCSPQPLLLWQNLHKKGIDDSSICTHYVYGTHNIIHDGISSSSVGIHFLIPHEK